jgi:adenine-specific DNA-methyltransferase
MPPKSIQRDRLRQTIQTLEGLTPEDRSALLGLLAETKRYGLVWEDKPEDAHELLREEIPVFKEDPSRRITASSEDAPHHVLIEGDNLHALAALQYTHAGQVDVIYIDPPYNTGNKDFRYNDDYVDKDDAWRHSKWLSFMKKRLELSKRLLAEAGVLFISIDDIEMPQIRTLCDEIFPGGFVACCPVVMNLKGNPDSYGFADTHEYLIVVLNNKESRQFGTFQIDDDKIDSWEEDDYGMYKRADTLRRTGQDASRERRPKGWFPVFITQERKVYADLNDAPRHPSDTTIYPINEAGEQLSWTWSRKKIIEESHNLQVIDGRNGLNIYKKQRPQIGDLPTAKPKSFLYRPEYSTSTSTNELKKILGTKAFNAPKPVPFLHDLLIISNSKNSLILDFFAGSGTTLHATMALNAEDGGKRQCILVTNNENKICEEVTYERNKRVIQGYTTPKGEQVAGLTANHLHYFKTDFVKREPSLKNRRQLMKLSVDLLRLKENAWDRSEALCVKNELEAFQGKEFTLFVVLDTDAIPTVIGHIKAQSGKAKVYVFSPGAYAWDEEFEEVRERIDLCAVPEAIYRALEPHLPAVKRIADEVAA